MMGHPFSQDPSNTAAFAAIIQQNPNIVDTVYDFRNFM